ncbi:hypothetical protein J5N97_029304 [Dioscorea zingiberensis]|uniref:WEB family protein n=1 Tax=Dioscorea zingiberensis TaxID=325984 RepID=A0A9D5C154_9LILI|nr:hypothetical protein J5N97_029304 [Dioscorea zingiberensis]
MESEEGGGGVAMERRVEIDTRAPFSSVKEAVKLFGERVLVGEIYGQRLNEMRIGGEKRNEIIGHSRPSSIAEELEETMKDLGRVREERFELAHCLSSLREELESTKKELILLKAKESSDKQMVHNVKFMIEPEIPVSESMPTEKNMKKKKKVLKQLIPFIGLFSSKKKNKNQELITMIN